MAMDEETIRAAAPGVAAWAMQGFLVARLVDRERLTLEELTQVIDDALAQIERLDSASPSPVYRFARALLEQEMRRLSEFRGS
jgi:hypothetical protein